MAVSFTLTASPVFPAGTLISAYARRDFAGGAPTIGQVPGGALVTATALVDEHGRAQLEGLMPEAGYFAGAEVGGVWRWVFFTTNAETGGTTTNVITAASPYTLSHLVTANYLLALSDVGYSIDVNSAVERKVFVPSHAQVPWQPGTVIPIAQLGVGAVTVVGEPGVTIKVRPGMLPTSAAMDVRLELRELAVDEWLLTGALTAAPPEEQAPPPTVLTPFITATTPPELQSNSKRLQLRGVTVWGVDDHVTHGGPFATPQYEARVEICKRIRELGGNCIRLRVLAEEYELNKYLTKAEYLARVKAWVVAAEEQGLFVMLCAWDPLDNEAKKEAGWIANQGYVNPMYKAIWEDATSGLKGHERLFFNVVNEPNHLTEAQNVTNFKTTIAYFRGTLKYGGVLIVDPTVYANSGIGGNWTALTAAMLELAEYDKAQMEAAGLGTHHQLAMSKHDYANEYPHGWSASEWETAVGGNQSSWVIVETEIGNYNGAGTENVAWSEAAINFMIERATHANFGGTVAFLWGPWFDGNAITTGGNSVYTPWGNIVRGLLAGTLATKPKPVAAIDINEWPTKASLERAKAAGFSCVRLDEAEVAASAAKGGLSFAGCMKAANEVGVGVAWLMEETTLAGLVGKYEALSTAEKARLLVVEYKNEVWPGGIGPQLSGAAYGAQFVAAAGEQQAKSFPVPLAMQVQTSSVEGANAWMKELMLVAGLKGALEPRAFLPGGNWLSSHPYGTSMLLAQKEINGLYAPQDVNGANFGSQRWMKQQQLVKEATGLVVPVYISEYGMAANTTPGGWAGVAAGIEALWQFVRKVHHAEVATAPAGLTPVLAMVAWYDFVAWGFGPPLGVESYGILKPDLSHNEESGVYAKMKAGVEAI